MHHRKKIALGAAAILIVCLLWWWANHRMPAHWDLQSIRVHTAGIRPFTDTGALRRRLVRALADSALPLGDALRMLKTIVEQGTYVRRMDVHANYTGKLDVLIDERVPLFRVIPRRGPSYYLSHDHVMLPVSTRTAVHTMVISGHIGLEYAVGRRADSGRLLTALRLAEAVLMHPYWKNQITQIHIDAQGRLWMGERVGRYRALIGKDLTRLDTQLLLLEKILPYIYESSIRTIDLRYPKQAIARVNFR